MDVYGYGNKIEIINNQNGFAKVIMDNQFLHVNCLVICVDSPNYTDTLKVQTSCQALMNKKRDKITFEDLKTQLKTDFGISKVFHTELQRSKHL